MLVEGKKMYFLLYKNYSFDQNEKHFMMEASFSNKDIVFLLFYKEKVSSEAN